MRARWPITYANSYSDSKSNTHFYSYSFRDTYAYTDTSSMHGEMFTDAETAAYTCTASDTLASSHSVPALL